MPRYDRYVGIDYSGAEVSTSSLKGLRVYLADRDTLSKEILPPPSPRKYWSRKEIAEWLIERLSEEEATLVGIDHGFSFPLRYFEMYDAPRQWPAFLDDFQRHCEALSCTEAWWGSSNRLLRRPSAPWLRSRAGSWGSSDAGRLNYCGGRCQWATSTWVFSSWPR